MSRPMKILVALTTLCTAVSLGGYPFNQQKFLDWADKYWGAPGWMDTRIVECSMKPEVRFGYREEAAADLLT